MADKKLSQLTPAQTVKIVTQRRPKIQKSLALLVVSLVGVRLVVELKNDIEITGILEESDENMNMTIQNAIQVFPNGNVRELEVVFVNGSHVRYVHIPPEINAVKHLNEYVSAHIFAW
jgi:small nuclear ribonucleoprotein (snRNP)-like protein